MRARGYAVLVVGWSVAIACGESSTHNSNHGRKDAGGGALATGGSSAGEAGAPTRGGSGGAGGAAGAPEGGEAGEGEAGAGGGGTVCTESAPVVITSEAELRAFAARGCEVLEGSLTITSPTLRSVDALGEPSVLRVITQNFLVEDNPLLESLEGFSGLERIGQSLTIRTSGMENLRGLESLRSIGSDAFAEALVIAENPALADVTALGGLTRLETGVIVAGNASLTSLLGIDRLVSANAITIANNAVLSEIGGFTDLEDALRLNVSSNPRLLSLSFPALIEVSSLWVTSHETLASVGLPVLERADTLTIAENQALTTLGTLDALESVGVLVITSNPMLPQCFVDALDARLQACGTSCTGNDTMAVCAP